MPEFSVAWFDDNIENWNQELARFKNKPGLQFLEIGSFEGRATRWLLQNVLTGTGSIIHVVDPFEGSPEHRDTNYAGVLGTLRQRFENNIAEFRDRVVIHQMTSHDALPKLRDQGLVFDFIYVDGSHHQDDVYLDAVLSWPLLKTNGILAFDDYKWQWRDAATGEVQAPKIGVDKFLSEHEGEFALIHKRWQLHIEKRPASSLESLLGRVRWSPLLSKFPLRKSQFRRLFKRVGINLRD